MLLDIVILPPAEVRRRFAVLARQFNLRYPARYVVDNKKLTPHISLYHFKSVKQRLPAITKEVRRVVCGIKKVKFATREIHLGRISLEVQLNCLIEVKRLNRKIMKSCAPFRTGPMPSTFPLPKNREARLAIKNYGTVGTVIHYEPHVTLLADFSRLLPGHKPHVVKKYQFAFIASTVAICEVNKWYQVTRILKRFKLS